MDIESSRLQDANLGIAAWRKWGPYLSERQWGTVREDYSSNGNAWDYFSHDQSRSRAYHWGEDGLAGISDNKQLLCFALALWNGKDPILKERLFGLTNSEGNHGEDCKEYYFYLDSTPTHSYMKYLYKYPQAAYPYADLLNGNRARNRKEPEYELLDTGIFNEDRYFDVFVEYAKETPEDVLVRITVCNRGPEDAALSLLPTLWFRNIWSWGEENPKPSLRSWPEKKNFGIVAATHSTLGEQFLYCERNPSLLFTENESNNQRLFGSQNNSAYVKDGIGRYVVEGESGAVNAAGEGTKAAARYHVSVPAHGEVSIMLRLSDIAPGDLGSRYPSGDPFGSHFTEILNLRRSESDAFYATVTPASLSSDHKNVMRQALAGMMWSKQYYEYNLPTWLREHDSNPVSNRVKSMRNSQWFHMVNADVVSMPDKWEYPWYAAWDLAFHTLALSIVDPEFARGQLDLVLNERYLHPNGQLPAYEWNFGDVNPPVHAWACIFNHRLLEAHRGYGDEAFLKRAFQKLLMNFTWWMNRQDRSGSNVFEGGFLGLDNVSVFDRSAPLPGGGYLEQADGTAWMALFAQNMMEIALELASSDPLYEELACKFFEHFLWISSAINKVGMWDENDGFFYDLMQLPDGTSRPLKVRTVVGLLPLCASTVFEGGASKHPKFMERAQWFAANHPELYANIHRPGLTGAHGRHLLALLNEDKLRRVLSKMLDENEFLSDYGIRSISRYHQAHPFVINFDGQEFRVDYLPAESDTGMFGGNSNWRGPIWVPTNTLIIRGLLQLYRYWGNDFTVECPTGSGKHMNLFETSQEISRRLSSIFLKKQDGSRPVYGGASKFQTDPHWKDYLSFYEYFHGDNGAGIGASHQTGWTGVIARIIELTQTLDADQFLREEKVLAALVTDSSGAAQQVTQGKPPQSEPRRHPGKVATASPQG
jgi:hypothetical protein